MKRITFIYFVLNVCFNTYLFSQPCLPDTIIFSTQAQIDSFQVNYPGCTEIEGTVVIDGQDIDDLTGLNVITSIGGHLMILENPILEDLSGLESLTTIGGRLIIGTLMAGANNSLLNLNGLDNINAIGGDLGIGFNINLENVEALNNLTSIGGFLSIKANFSLGSLQGLGNIEPSSIEELNIFSNTLLTECDVESICQYLLNPTGTVTIDENASGCNSLEEVVEACESVTVEKMYLEKILTISPNPIESKVNIIYSLEGLTHVNLSIIDNYGRLIIPLIDEMQYGEQNLAFSIEDLKPGTYFLMFKTNQGTQVQKIIKF